MAVKEFITYLKTERKTAENTREAYFRDLTAFERFLRERGREDLDSAGEDDVAAYMLALKNSGKSGATANRKLSSIRAYYRYRMRTGAVDRNPAEEIRAPKIQRKALEYLTIEEVEKLLSLPDDTAKGIRDRAMLEVLYGTGVRVSEIIEMKLKDINLRIGFVTCSGKHGRARIVPLGGPAKEAAARYLQNSRSVFLRGKDEEDPEQPFFVNYAGGAFSRQGFWKVLKQYGREAGLEDRLTPHILRTSFAVHMVQNGADLKSLQELLGNEDILASEIYLSVVRSRIKDVYDKTHPRA